MSATTVEAFTCTACGYRFEAADLPTECPKCRVHGSARNFPSDKTLTTACQNDAFRAGMVVGGCPLPGTVVVTSRLSVGPMTHACESKNLTRNGRERSGRSGPGCCRTADAGETRRNSLSSLSSCLQ